MKTKLQIPPGSYFFSECDGKIVFNEDGKEDKGDWKYIDSVSSTHKKKLIAACACHEWIKLTKEQINEWEAWGKE